MHPWLWGEVSRARQLNEVCGWVHQKAHDVYNVVVVMVRGGQYATEAHLTTNMTGVWDRLGWWVWAAKGGTRWGP